MNQARIRIAIAAVATALAIAGCGSKDPEKFVASGESYLAKGDYRAAVIELKNALAQAPDNARARFLLGKASLDGGDPVSAAMELRKAAALKYPADDVYPLLARALLQQNASRNEMAELAAAPVESNHAKAEVMAAIGTAAQAHGDLKEAHARIDAALALEPANATAQIARARLLMADGDTAGALQEIDGVLAKAPDNVQALVFKGELLIARHDRSGAAAVLERVVAAHPNATFARYLLVTTYLQGKELDKAGAQVEELKKVALADPRTQHAIGMLALARGDIPTALAAVQKALQTAPDYMPAVYLSGLVDLSRGANSTAEQSLRKVVAKLPQDNGARVALAQVVLRLGQPAKAREILEPVLQRVPDDVGAMRLAAEVELAMRNPDRAARYVERANSIDESVDGRVRLAQIRLAQGDTDEGIRELETLSKSDPGTQAPDVALVAAHLRARRFNEALAAADALVGKQPKSPAAYTIKGTVYAAKGDSKAARETFEKALTFDAAYVPALMNLGLLDARARHYADAKRRFEQVLAKDPKSERALLALAQILAVEKAPDADIVAALQRAVEANPGSVAARLSLVNFHVARKNWGSALTAAQQADTAIPGNAAIVEALANAQLASGEKNQAIANYQRQTKLQPDNLAPRLRLAAAYASSQNYNEAIAALKGAMAVAPTNTAVWAALAAVYAQAGQMDQGMAEARRLQKDLTTRSAGYALEAELFAAQKKVGDAVASYRASLARDPQPYTVLRLHALLDQSGKADEAASVAQKWVKEHPKDGIVRGYLANVSLAKRDYKTAAAQYRGIVEREPSNVSALNNLAWSLSELEDPQAKEYAERAYKLAPGNPSVVNTYGWVLVQQGDTARGIEMLRKSVELDPDDAGRRLYLARALIKSGDKPEARKELEIVSKAESPKTRAQAEELMKLL